MHTILLLGAGQSSSALIAYLLKISEKENIQLLVADKSLEIIMAKIKNHPNATAILLEVEDTISLKKNIKACSIVISMLPADKHIIVAKECLRYKKNLVTASYITDEMRALDFDAKEKNLLFLNEVGLDPGIDHMSAMKIIASIRKKKGKIISFESACGGLLAPKSAGNLWKYKFTWAPKNVVLAGQGKSSVYLQNGKKITVPYSELFLNTTPINSSKLGKLEAYPNRDSLQYKEIYNLSTAETVLRSTVRYPGFCAAWWVFVRLGMTNNKKILSATAKMSYCEYVQLFLPKKENDTVEKNFQKFLNLNDKQDVWKKLLELDIFSTSKKIGINKATSAQILEKILKESWTLASNETDVVVMKHSVSYLLNNKKETIHSELILEGVNNLETAMAACVGLPVAMAAILILKNKINVRGVQIPIYEEIYEPILEELKLNGIGFTETHA